MDEVRHRVGYVGASTLNHMATGIGVLQKPLKELYFGHRTPDNPRSLPERYLTLGRNGLVMSWLPEDGSTSQPMEEYYHITDVLLWDAVRFITVQGADKKSIKSAFEPLDNDHSKVKDNLFVTLEKKYHYLHKMTHPAMFTCVIRRKQGVKLLYTHVFVCSSVDSAVTLVAEFNQLQSDYQLGQVQQTGVFEYKPFGGASALSSPSVTSGPSVSPVSTHTNQSLTPSGAVKKHSNQTHTESMLNTDLNNVTSHFNNRHITSNHLHKSHSDNLHSKRNDLQRDRNVVGYTESVKAKSRVFHLSQEDLFGGSTGLSIPDYKAEREPVDEDEYGYQYLPHITHSLEKVKQRGELYRTSSVVSENNLLPSDVIKRTRPTSPQSSTGSSSSKSSSQHTDNKPFNYLEIKTPKNVVHRSLSPKKLQSGNDGNMGQGYSLLSGPNNMPPPRSVSSDQINREMFQELIHYQQQQQGSYGVERAAPRPSKLRPPKSPGYLEHPPSQQQHSPEDNTTVHNPFNSEAVKTKPIARVPPHLITGVPVLPTTTHSPHQNVLVQPETSNLRNTYKKQNEDPVLESHHTRKEQYGCHAEQKLHSRHAEQKLHSRHAEPKLHSRHAEPKRNWHLGSNIEPRAGETQTASSKNRQKESELLNNMDDKLGEKLLLSKKKDAEIASVMQNLKLESKDLTLGAPGGMNFEKSLGYFP